VAVSPDGKYMISGSGDKTLKVWDAQTGQEVRTLKGHTSFVAGVAVSPNGQRIVSLGEEVKVWDAATGQEVRTLQGLGAGHGVAVSPDSLHIVTGGDDNTVKVWRHGVAEELPFPHIVRQP